ncbi:calcineurin-like phosphoesterase C-terminal domain-containing protein [Kineococcus radiotolerans]|uniref:Metallophosphoesterase n=1 Tax=Kineococcus radiotolerans (strain ATCC BAA-149 / DSM 14245 / SRS30216) TaxID=266940 RepID=A6WFZ7_KINRD|nr:calcineurin-like phosphoesterase family protein [Kineococcus radiotolerans]ABS05736.1 metallophosphoesterase [Kineococcus radiotolerans SRS30216 = ATCC BAA-149]
MRAKPVSKNVRRHLGLGAGVLLGASVLTTASTQAATTPTADRAAAPTYVGAVEVVRDVAATTRSTAPQTLRGRVFHDADRDGRSSGDEGVEGVTVSNGRDVVVTDEDGDYELPVFDGMSAFVTQPSGWQVPVDEDGVAQFSYHHLPAGSPQLRFGGLEPTGPLPTAVNFPLVEGDDAAQDAATRCAVLADVQTYNGRELGFARDGLLADLVQEDGLAECGALMLGDVAGDDLGLYPRIKEVLGASGLPLRFVPGNHDLDLDATDAAHSFDTFKRELGPTTYSYDVADVHYVVMNNVKYPCTPEDDADGTRPHCADPVNAPTYSGQLGDEQVTWLANDLARVPEDKLVVIATHIPMVSFADQDSTKHQTKEVQEVHELLEGRPALSVSGHTHSTERMNTGDSYAGWKTAVGVDELPFPHVVAGAPSGDWYSGDLDVEGRPMALQRDGARPGYLTLDVDGSEYVDTFHAIGEPDEKQMAVSLNSPRWRDWYTTITEWAATREGWDQAPPVNVNDLGDPGLVTTADVAADTWLTANVWYGSTDTEVEVSIDGGDAQPATRTQQAAGEAAKTGAQFADPAAATRQLQVARFGFESTSGDPTAQGYELYAGSEYGPGPAQPGNNVADRATHLWQYRLPSGLPEGVHRAEVTATDSFGRERTETHVFEVRAELPQQSFRSDVFGTE